MPDLNPGSGFGFGSDPGSTKPITSKPLGTLTDYPMPERPSGKRTVVPPHTGKHPIHTATLPEWPDYLVETWHHVINSTINSTNFVSFIRTRVGNTPYKGKLTATLQDVQLTQSIEDGPTVKAVVENMIELCLKEMNDEIEAAKAKSLAAQDAEKKRAAAEAAAEIELAKKRMAVEKLAQESYEKKLREQGFMFRDLTQQPLPPPPVDRRLSAYVQRQVDINRQQLYMQTQDKTTPQQRNRIKEPTKADELNRIIENAFKAYGK